MRTRAHIWINAVLLFLAFGRWDHPASAATAEIDPIKQHDQLVGELTSGDDARISKAYTLLQAYMKKKGDK